MCEFQENPAGNRMCSCTLNTGEVIESRYIICPNLGIAYFEKVINTGKYVVKWHYVDGN